MTITKCDICKKVIKDRNKRVDVGVGWLSGNDICLDCGKPMVKFLVKHKLVDKEKIDTLSI